MRFTIATFAALTLMFGGLAGRAEAQAATFTCAVEENGAAAQGTFSITENGAEVARGACGSPVSVPAGAAVVTIQLDGALDAPREQRNVVLRAGQTERVSVSFSTGTLSVACEAQGRRAAGRVTLFKDGRQVGTLGSGVDARLSAGTYQVVVRYHSGEQRFDVTITQGRRTEISATF